MKYQLVIQFPSATEDDFERLIEIEDKLEDGLSDNADVDGHDFGSGEMNIFILTNEPAQTFEEANSILAESDKKIMKVAYRDLESEDFKVLWPCDLTEFVVT